MSISAATLQLLMEAGLQGESLLNVVRSIEADTVKPSRSQGAERQRRYRENKKARETGGDVTRDVTRDASPAPSFLSLSPTPPNPNQSTPNPPPYSPPALKPDDVWAITPRQGRERSSKRDVERAFAAAVKRGGSPEAILAGVKAYYASDDATRDGGQFAKGVHRIIENDRWQSYTPEDKPPDWENFLATWRATGRWPKSLGPPPDHPETQVPSALRAA